MTLRILISGAKGKVGRCLVEGVNNADDMLLVSEVDKHDDLKKAIKSHQPDVAIDFTAPDAAYANTLTIIEEQVHPVIGTTGFTPEQITSLTELCAQHKLGGVIAPNFSISAILMMRFSQIASTYFDSAEIIEMHHSTKKDAPSGTAIKTAEVIAESAQHAKKTTDIPIHSVRLPGLVAHQAVMFSAPGEVLTIKQDTTGRESFVPGVLLACRKVKQLNTLLYGLDPLLDAQCQ